MNQNRRARLIFYPLWILLALMQSYFTELQGDEAYYWMYSQELAWGYFDHPPVVAFLIKLGYSFFSNELGVRLFSLLASAAAIRLIEELIQPKKPKLYYLLVSSVALLHFFGFMAVPDAPLLLFAAAYLLIFKKFIATPSLFGAILLGLSVGLMMLSKYHGVLLVAFSLIPHLRLLNRWQSWLAIAIAGVVMIPHLEWMVSHQFPSIRYHLFERSTELYDYRNTLNYLSAQPFVLGPLVSILFFFGVAKQKTKDGFEKSLKWIYWGLFGFFFLMTFKDRVEAHWTFLAVIPGLYFTYFWIERAENARKWALYLCLPSIVLLMLTRTFIAFDILPEGKITIELIKKFHSREARALLIEEVAGERPVLFMNSYQRASLYQFYVGKESASLNNIMSRKNQFDVWNYENRLRGSDAILVPNYERKDLPYIDTSPPILYKEIPNFQSYSCVGLEAMDPPSSAILGDTISLRIAVTGCEEQVDLMSNSEYPSYITSVFFEGGRFIKAESTELLLTNAHFGDTVNVDVIIPPDIGELGLYFCLVTGWLPGTYNSDRVLINVQR